MQCSESKVLILGDIHGRTEIVKRAYDTGLFLIFVGDFCDSFNRTREEQIQCIKLVLAMKKEGRALFLLGNHEWSYIDPPHFKCSGYARKMRDLLQKHNLLSALAVESEDFILLGEDILVTHAGVDRRLWELRGLSLKHLEWRFAEAKKDPYSWYHQVGLYRGGGCEYGGPLWCDWNTEFRPIPGVRQIVGHTNGISRSPGEFRQHTIHGIRFSDNGDCNIDCQDREEVGLLFEEGKLTPYPLYGNEENY